MAFLPGASPAQAQALPPREFRLGSLRHWEELPDSRLRTQIRTLSGPAQRRSVQWLQSFHFTEEDLRYLHADAQGGIYYACPPADDPAPARHLQPGEPAGGDGPEHAHEPIPAVEAARPAAPEVSEAPVPVDPFPDHLKFHSRRLAPNVIYLNFAGERVTGTEWNSELGRSTIVARPFSTDGDPLQYSDSEQEAIKRIWQRVAEDYAPFNVDVTTERPASFGRQTAHVVITRSTDATGNSNPASSAGGVAYVNVFGTTTFTRFRPAWVYANNLANDESYIAEAVSHEVGHNLGLSHDGTREGSEYYGGHGFGEISWNAIMGAGYDRNVSQWSKGEYRSANNTQDDLATLAGKLAYRSDDHGNTPATATPLVITDANQIVSTTPEDDPDNGSRGNKGVINRGDDLDVFSFVTGAGPVRLEVNPWVTPGGGTRGNNLDVLIELSNSAGTVLATDNPPDRTGALITTNLAAGRYYLTVRNTGTGDPFALVRSGYTAYGSLGQYFIEGSIVRADGVVIPPLAEMQPLVLDSAGQAAVTVTVTYADDGALAVSSFDSQDLRVIGPNGFDQPLQFVSSDLPDDGTPRTVTYSLAAPDGAQWLPADNGLYTVWIQADQVKDTQGASLPAGELGQFEVAVPQALYTATMDASPGWTLDAQWAYGQPRYTSRGPTSGFTGDRVVGYRLSSDYTANLPPRYATTPVIDCSSVQGVSLRFKRWLRVHPNDRVAIQVTTDGRAWTDVWSTTRGVFDTNWVSVQHVLPEEVAGHSRVRLRWMMSSSNDQTVDIGWHLDDVEVLGSGVLDSKAPVPELLVADLTSKGSPTHSCAVTYRDETAVRLSTLDSADLRVTGPNGYSRLIDFEGADLPADGTPCTATYSIPAPNVTWSAADNGTYVITLQDGAVEDTSGNATAETVLGGFEVAISLVEPGQLEVTPDSTWTLEGPQGGPFSPSTREYTLANRGEAPLNWTADSLFDWLGFSTTQGTLEPGQSVPVTVSLTAGATQLGAGLNSGWVNFANTTSGLGTTRRNVDLTVVASAHVQLQVDVNEPTWGRVEPGSGSYPTGSSVQLQAIPAQYFRFQNWGGDAPGTDNPQTVILSRNLIVLAVFQEILTTAHPTPHWWLAEQGHTQNFEAAVDVIGANGLPLWQSYVAGLNPQDPASQLRLASSPAPSGTGVNLTWNPVAGRTYTVRAASSLDGPFAPVAGAVDLPSTVSSFTAPLGVGTTTYYRIDVEKP